MEERSVDSRSFLLSGGGNVSKRLTARDCANLAKEYNGENNWCLLRDAHCPLVVKHERYKFDKADIRCTYLDGLNASVSEPKTKFRTCGECQKKFKGRGRAKYCGNVCRSIAKKRSNRKSYANQENSRKDIG
jgi:hypothetical protein